MIDPTDYSACLQALFAAQPDVRFVFVAKSVGDLLAELGSKADLEYSSVIEVAMRPESIQTFYEEILSYELQDPGLVPRLYAQGRTNGVLARPSDGLLVGVFADMPSDIYNSSPEDRVQWISQYRARVWDSIKSVFPRNTA